ncbi:hypothetical protein LINGRAPRIM_LOCUS506 [Linum grandiflorum]
MLRRKPTKIEVATDDKEKLKEARRRSADSAATTTATSAASSLAHLLDPTQPTSKFQRISLSS